MTIAARPCPLPDVAAAQACAHCGLDVPEGLLRPDQTNQFCCNACETVWGLLHDMGMESYYRVRDTADAPRERPRDSAGTFGEFDDPVFHERHVRALNDNTREVELFVDGVHCAACVWLLERLAKFAPGVIESRLDLGRAMLTVRWDANAISLSHIARAINRLGYVPCAAGDEAARDARRRSDRAFLVRIAVAGALAGNTMLIAFALYGGAFTGMEPHFQTLFRWLSMVFGLASLAWPGRIFFRGALGAIRARSPHMDIPVALGLAAGGLMGTINTIRGSGEIYFDSVTVLVLLLLCGRWLSHRQQRSAADAVELLHALTPTKARLVEGSTSRDVPIDALHIGALVEIRPGETVPGDGIVESGSSAIDQSILTGETRGETVNVGDHICAGAVNQTAPIRIRITVTGDDTRVARLMKLVADASTRRAPIVQAADRVAAWFVLAVTLGALATLAAWFPSGAGDAVQHATSLLIVTCPCALALATPLAIAASVGRAARARILIKGGEALEHLARPGTMLLDKTGTITEGRLRVIRWHGDESLKPIVAAIESQVAHPIATALARDLANTAQATNDHTLTVQHVPGSGVRSSDATSEYAVGSPAFVRSLSPTEHDWIPHREMEVIEEGLTPVFVATADATGNWQVAAIIGLGDAIRPDAAESINTLRSMGWKLGILSGDHPAIVANVARRLGLDNDACHGNMRPEDKLKVIESHDPHHRIVMVGDGVNDAAALAAATVGIAVKGGAAASLAAADIYLDAPGLRPVVDVCQGSSRTLRVIRQGITVSLLYNAVAASLAITGMIGPLVAAILMPLSSITVVALAMRSSAFGRPS